MNNVDARQAARWCRAQLELGEGPRWVDGRLVLVDILTGRLLEADRHGALRPLHKLDVPLGAVAPAAGTTGGWIAAVGTGIALLGEDGDLEWLAQPAEHGPIPRRMNDGVCDPAGRFWAGCMAWDATPGAGALYRVDHDGIVEEVLDGLTVPNGPAFSSDGTTMYLADSPRGRVYRYTVDPASGDLGKRDLFVTIDDGTPDGMALDVDGNLWLAIWGRGEVRQYTPEGKLTAVATVPARQPTAPCLGGPAGTTLFITSARYSLGEHATAQCGDIFSLEVATPGTPAIPFGPPLPARTA